MRIAPSAQSFASRIIVDPLIEPLLYSVGVQRSGGYVRCWLNEEAPKNLRGRCWGLHVVSWTVLIGPVPRGWHVHHKDDNTFNNSIENLEALPARWHLHLTHVGKPKPAVSKRMLGVPKSAEHRAKISTALRKYFDVRNDH